MGFGEGLRWLNTFAIPDENLNGIAIAICALISVFAAEATLERLVVTANHELTSESVLGYLILRSHSSLVNLYKIWCNRPIGPQGDYHGAQCRCAEVGRYALPDGEGCAFRNGDAPVLSRILIKTTFLRALFFAVEIVFVSLALTVPRNTPLSVGKYALTVNGNNFGVPVRSPLTTDKPLGCYEIFDDRSISARTINFNRISQIVQCTVKLRPATVTSASTIPTAGAPPGFSTFVLDLDISGDDVVIMDVGKKYDGAEVYVYWKSKDTIPEGAVPLVAWGREYSAFRENAINITYLIPWRRAVDKTLRGILGKEAYQTAYGGAHKWGTPDEDLVRMVMYIDMNKLPQRFEAKGNESMGYLLNELLSLQKGNEKSGIISYSDGTVIQRTKEPVLAYVITGPILGLVPWILLTLATSTLFGLISWWRPNRFLSSCFPFSEHSRRSTLVPFHRNRQEDCSSQRKGCFSYKRFKIKKHYEFLIRFVCRIPRFSKILNLLFFL